MKNLFQSVLQATKGRFFGVTFIKADGTLRKMTCRLGVHKHATGRGLKYNPAERGNVIVWDTSVKGYRTIKLDRLVSLRFGGEEIHFQS
jgi:hypothetical protein